MEKRAGVKKMEMCMWICRMCMAFCAHLSDMFSISRLKHFAA